MRVVLQSSAAELAAAAGALLASDPAHNTLLLSVLGRAGETAARRPFWGAVALDARRAVLACMVRDRAAVFVSTGSERAARALGRTLRNAQWQESIVGPETMASECARAIGLPSRTAFVLPLLRLDGAPRFPASFPGGRMRGANDGDRTLLLEWSAQFRTEARLVENADEAAARLLERLNDGGLRIWIDAAGEPVAFAGFARVGATGARIAPVYTPAALRGRGFGQALVANVCVELQHVGAASICLFTDLTNASSNALYRRVGFEPHGRHLHLIVTRPQVDADG
jgi:predicted GNAT family acetyltransferase